MSFESNNQIPTEEEIKKIEEVVKEETQSNFFGSYEQLTPEEKKEKYLSDGKQSEQSLVAKHCLGSLLEYPPLTFMQGKLLVKALERLLAKHSVLARRRSAGSWRTLPQKVHGRVPRSLQK